MPISELQAITRHSVLMYLHRTALRPLHTEHEKVKQISDAMTCWNKTIDFYGCVYIDREHSRTENANVFLSHQSDESFQFRKAKTWAVQ